MFLRFSMSSLATLASVLTHCEDPNHNSVRPTMASSIGTTAIVTIIIKATLAARNVIYEKLVQGKKLIIVFFYRSVKYPISQFKIDLKQIVKRVDSL